MSNNIKSKVPVAPRSLSPIVVSANSSWNIINFRSGLIRHLIELGYRVVVLAPEDDQSERIAGIGAEHRIIRLNSSGLSPFNDARAFYDYYQIMRDLRPRAFLGFTAKPNIYGALAAHALNIPVLNNISGLGVSFSKPGLLQSFVSGLYTAALRRSSTVFFQNRDDQSLFLDRRIVRPRQARLLCGSGVDLDVFVPREIEREPGPLRFLLVARMLWDKGVGQFVEAARTLRAEGRDAHFALLGPAAVDNRSAISLDQLQAWDAEGVVAYLGASNDVRDHLARADCVVLPSYYREGVPRTLIEAAAMGRPIITTDEIGCRDAVDDGVTGVLCASRSAPSLAASMRHILDLPPSQLAKMGENARAKAVRQFDERQIANAYAIELDRRLGLNVQSRV